MLSRKVFSKKKHFRKPLDNQDKILMSTRLDLFLGKKEKNM